MTTGMSTKPRRRLFGTIDWSHWPVRIMAGCAVLALVVSTGALLLSMYSTQEQLRLTRETLELSQRPWVVQENLRLPTPVELAPGQFKAELVWKNTGNGPARDLRVFVTPVERPADVPLPEVWEFWSERKQGVLFSTIGLFGPGQTKSSNIDYTLDAADVESTVKGSRIFNVVGWATYRDIFDVTHWTTFCVEFQPAAKRFDYCETGNDMGSREP